MSGEKPAPTAAEIAEARGWLDEVTLSILKADGHERTVDHIRTLLAALDAAEAEKTSLRSLLVTANKRTTLAEADLDLWREMLTPEFREKIAALRTRAETAERERDEANRRATAAEERAESVHAAWSKCLKLLATAERERDEARERGFAAGAEAVRATLKRQCKEAPRG